MNTTCKTLSAIALAGMIAGLSVSNAMAAQPGTLAKGKTVVFGADDSCSGHDGCDGSDSCDSKDSCDAKDNCEAKDSCEAKE